MEQEKEGNYVIEDCLINRNAVIQNNSLFPSEMSMHFPVRRSKVILTAARLI